MIKNFDSIEEFKEAKDKKTAKKEVKEAVFTPKIAVLGIGGSGTNAINNLIKMGLNNIKFLVANTDVKSLDNSNCPNKIRLGLEITKGLGAGSNPEIGFKAAEQSAEEIATALEGVDLLFLIAGMGGGTGTGASPVITKIAKDLGILTLGFVTKPFEFEGKQRMYFAEQGLQELEKYIDSIIIMSNQNLFKVINEKTSMLEAFRVTDNVIYSGIKAISDLITANGMVNLDFNDIKFIINGGGKAVVTSAEVSGNDKVHKITESILNNPLIDDDINIMNAKNILISIAGGLNMTLFEVDQIINSLRNKASKSTYVNFGAIFDETMAEKVRVAVIATGIYNNDENHNSYNKVENKTETTPNNSIMHNVLQEEPVKKEKEAVFSKIEQEFKTNDKLDSNPFSNSNVTTEEFSANNHKIADNDLAFKELQSKSNINNKKNSSLFSLIEKQPNSENDIALMPKSQLETFSNIEQESSKEQNNKNKTSKSFFELPPFLRQRK